MDRIAGDDYRQNGGGRRTCRLLLPFAATAVVILVAQAGSPRTDGAAAACSNEAIRSEQGSAALALPDCRAYELVTPGSTPSLTTDSTLGEGGKAARSGEAVSYVSRYPADGSRTSSETWLARRTASGWLVEGLDPQQTTNPSKQLSCLPGTALSEDLEASLLSSGMQLYPELLSAPEGECQASAAELVPGEPRGYSNLYLRRAADLSFVLVNALPPGATPANGTYQAASADLSRIVFSEEARLTANAPPGYNLYEWADGVVRLVGILPNGEPTPADLGAATAHGKLSTPVGGSSYGLAPVTHAVSADGERVYFEANGNLYLRENALQTPAAITDCRTSEPGLACTMQVDISRGLGPSGGGVFQFASRDGSRAFFTSDHPLTFPSSAGPGKPDLYEYDVANDELFDLTVATEGTANVQGISGGSDDASYLYFVARGVLTGAEENDHAETAELGEPNLYVAHDRILTYVATLAPWTGNAEGGLDNADWWRGDNGNLRTAWSPFGRYLLLNSRKALTGVDNGATEELFLYDAEQQNLHCLSCDPSGAKPLDDSGLTVRREFDRGGRGPRYAPRYVLDSGQAFFETKNPLSPRDVNGTQDVYEYRNGAVRLISSGTAEGGTGFVDASADGRDVFIAVPDALVRSDTDGLPSIYDARVGGGFPEPVSPLSPCGDVGSCRNAASAVSVGGPASTQSFAGAGNVRPRPCKKGRVRRGGHCLKKKHHRDKGCKRTHGAGKAKKRCGDHRKRRRNTWNATRVGRGG